MMYIFIPLVAIVAANLVKFFVFIWQRKKFVGNRFIWSFFWMGNFPSVHSAALASMVYLIGRSEGFSPLFGFAAVISIVVIYSLLEDKKREILYEQYFLSSKNDALVKMSKEGILRDFSGHTLIDIVSGIGMGVLVAAILIRL